MTQSIIKLDRVKFGYAQDENLFDNLCVEFEKGETVGLIGSNGAGKSTLLKLLVGLQIHTDGEVEVAGVSLCESTVGKIRDHIGYAFQDADAQLFMTSVYEDVAFGPRNKGKSEAEVKALVKAALDTVEAFHLKDKPPYKLSGGEKRSVALATVLAMEPDIIVLDEPTTGLDPRGRRNLVGFIQALDQTKIIATHDMEMAVEICDRVIVMHEGRIMANGSPDKVFMDLDMLEACHLEQPYSMKVCPACGK